MLRKIVLALSVFEIEQMQNEYKICQILNKSVEGLRKRKIEV